VLAQSMNTFVDYDHDLSVPSNGPLAFHRRDGEWYLELSGRPLYDIGYSCGTCQAVFERSGVRDLPLAPPELRDLLEAGLRAASHEVTSTVGRLLPRGAYKVALLSVLPVLSIPIRGHLRRPNWSRHSFLKAHLFSRGPDYSWLAGFRTTTARTSYEVILPLIPRTHIDSSRVRFYSEMIKSGAQPTALALSILDDCNPMGQDFILEGLAHFLIDGHHKMMAASALRKPIHLLSFLAHREPRESLRSWTAP
jgi:hypothetical protein